MDGLISLLIIIGIFALSAAIPKHAILAMLKP